MRSSNPIFKENVFTQNTIGFATEGEVMTVQGSVNKSFILLACVVFTAGIAWYQVLHNPVMLYPLLFTGVIGGLIVAIITAFSPKSAPITAPIYALFEGLFLGTISLILNLVYPGIVFQAILLTFGVFFCLLSAYKAGMIQATEQFRTGIMVATGAIALIYLVSWMLRLFMGAPIPYIHEGGWVGIGFSLVVVGIAALNLILDFDFIEKGAERGSPKYMEWYAAFGLTVTLVWLYIEILNLLAKLRR